MQSIYAHHLHFLGGFGLFIEVLNCCLWFFVVGGAIVIATDDNIGSSFMGRHDGKDTGNGGCNFAPSD